MQSTYDYIIIGSGFGGSVSAMRLAEKGYSVLVIEKGKNYQAEDFPKSNWNIRKYFWAPFIKCFGFFKMNFFKDVVIVSGVGVGGGSIVYANTHVMPSDKFYTNKVWSSYNDWKETLLPFYNKAKFMLGTTKNKLFNREDEALREVAIEMDKLDSFDSVNVGVYFGDTENEKDPYFSGIGPKRKGCIECAGCMVGCQHNAKNTLDKNYLFFAKKFGTEILAETLAYKIEYDNDEYIIHTCSSKSWFKRNKRTFKSTGIIFSAGVLGTIDLLFKQKHKYKTLNNISDSLGFNLRTNSESLCAVTSKNEKLNHGIAISSVFEPDEHTHVEIVKYPDGSSAMKWLSTIAAGSGPPIVRIAKLLWNIITRPINFIRYIFGFRWAEKTVILLVMQNLDNSMKMIFKKFPFSRISISNKGSDKIPSYIDIGQKTMNLYAQKVNGIAQNAVTEIFFNMSSTAHIIGGCPMGKTKEDGVVNEKFEVFGYKNMYILDGSIIPCNLGVNPSLTITALSEYAMSLISEKEGNNNISLDQQLAQLADSK